MVVLGVLLLSVFLDMIIIICYLLHVLRSIRSDEQ
jgi:hypothetical protein